MAINKTEFVEQIAARLDLSKAESGRLVNGVLEQIEANLAAGEKTALTGFGAFEVVEREARKGRNPATGAEIDIPASRAPKFSAGAQLKAAVNG